MESWLFDFRHGVRTRATKRDSAQPGQDVSQGFWYAPTRPRTIRAILRELPVENYADYTFIDFGSGKGRVILLAAEKPFARVVGIERNATLQRIAEDNLRSKRNFDIRCQHIELQTINALDYDLPGDNLVLYFFNPFGEEIMAKLLKKIEKSLREKPREIFVAMVYPEHSAVMDGSEYLRTVSKKPERKVYRSCWPEMLH